MNRGFVQIDDSAFLTEEEELKNYLVKDSEESEVIMLEQKMSHVNQAINIVSSLVKQKIPTCTKREFNKIDSEKEGQVYAEALELNNLHKEIGTIRSNINLLNNNKSMLEPWVNFDIPIENMETKYTKLYLELCP